MPPQKKRKIQDSPDTLETDTIETSEPQPAEHTDADSEEQPDLGVACPTTDVDQADKSKERHERFKALQARAVSFAKRTALCSLP